MVVSNHRRMPYAYYDWRLVTVATSLSMMIMPFFAINIHIQFPRIRFSFTCFFLASDLIVTQHYGYSIWDVHIIIQHNTSTFIINRYAGHAATATMRIIFQKDNRQTNRLHFSDESCTWVDPEVANLTKKALTKIIVLHCLSFWLPSICLLFSLTATFWKTQKIWWNQRTVALHFLTWI